MAPPSRLTVCQRRWWGGVADQRGPGGAVCPAMKVKVPACLVGLLEARCHRSRPVFKLCDKLLGEGGCPGMDDRK